MLREKEQSIKNKMTPLESEKHAWKQLCRWPCLHYAPPCIGFARISSISFGVGKKAKN
jgi:hypothetical protein